MFNITSFQCEEDNNQPASARQTPKNKEQH